MQVRLIDYNYTQVAATSTTASSSDASFPVANIKNPIRSRVWRSSGNFVITSSNNKINFKEASGGSEFTATVAAGTYTPTTLAAAIKAALEVPGVDTFTVTYSSSTGKWTIASNGSYLALLWLTGTNTATAMHSTLGFAVADNTGALTYTGANIAIHTEEWVRFDLGTTESIDSFAALVDLVNGSKFSDNAVIKIQANASDSWSAPSVDQTVTFDDDYDLFTHFFSSNQTYRYWRVKIVDPQNAYLYVELSKVILGLGVQLDALPGNGTLSDTLTDTSKIQETEYGHRYADIYPIRREITFNYPGLSAADTQSLMNSFRLNGSVTPVALAIDPTATAYDKDRFFIYGFFEASMVATQISGTNFSVPIGIIEAV